MGILFAVIAAVFAALVVVLTKAGLKEMDPVLAFAVQAVLILIITWGIVTYEGSARQLAGTSRRTWIFILCAGVCTALSSVFSFRALKLADASLVSPIERSSLVIAIILAAVFLKEKMSWQAIAGVVLMTGGALLIGFAKK